MKINVHAGHNPDGKVACGAIGLIKESTEARNVKELVISLLKAQGNTVYDCTIDDGISQADILNKIVEKCNSNEVDLDVSIHFNAVAYDLEGNGITTGTEAYIYSSNSQAKKYAERVCEKISELGYRNRGVKVKTNLAVLRRTKAPAMLIECCFVDDKDDIDLYSASTMAQAIAEGILNKKISTSQKKKRDYNYYVRCGRFKTKEGAERKAETIKKVTKFNAKVVKKKDGEYNYYVRCGYFEKKENAVKKKEKLKKAGFPSRIVTLKK